MEGQRVQGSAPRIVGTVIGCFLLIATFAMPAGSRPAPTVTLSAQGVQAHPPILIRSDSDFTSANGVRSGDGTPGNPFVISDWSITAPICPAWTRCPAAVQVNNTTAAFVIRGLQVSNGAAAGTNNTTIGVGLLGVQHARIENVAASEIMVGVDVHSSSDVAIANMSITATVPSGYWQTGWYYGLDIESARQVEITNVSISRGFDSPLLLFNVSHAEVQQIHVERTVPDNVRVYQCDNVTLADLSLASNGYGAFVAGSQDVSVLGSVINASFPIGVLRSSRVTFVGNTIPTWLQSAAYLVDVEGFFAYHNNFLYSLGYPIAANNTTAVSLDSGYPGGGNYWSDYRGADNCSGPNQADCTNRDGIGDTPYSLGEWDPIAHTGGQAVAIDRYPLIRPWPLPIVSPHVVLTVTPSSDGQGTRFSFNASKSWDARDPVSDLQFWFTGTVEGATLFSTGWSNRSTYNTTFTLPGEYQVTVKVRNTAGLIGEVTVVLLIPEPPSQVLILLAPIALGLAGVVVLIFLRRRGRRISQPPAQDQTVPAAFASDATEPEGPIADEPASGRPPET